MAFLQSLLGLSLASNTDPEDTSEGALRLRAQQRKNLFDRQQAQTDLDDPLGKPFRQFNDRGDIGGLDQQWAPFFEAVQESGERATGNGSMTWTVSSGNRTDMRYWLKGRTLFVSCYIQQTTVGGVLNNILRVDNTQFGGFSSVSVLGTQMVFPCQILDNGTRLVGLMLIGANVGVTNIAFTRSDNANWAASTGNTYCIGTLPFEVQ